MELLAETKIGRKMYGNMWYGYGMWADSNLTLDVCGSNDERFSAVCYHCKGHFSFNHSADMYKRKIFCPCCGREHGQENIRYSASRKILFPAVMTFRLYRLKNKVQLRIFYEGSNLLAWKWHKVQEYFTFDVKHKKATWRQRRWRTLGTDEEDNTIEIGYLTEDMEKIQKSSIISICKFSDTYVGKSLKDLLIMLCREVNKLAKGAGLSEKNLYIGGDRNFIFSGNILNLAHRVRFWDVPNMEILGKAGRRAWLNKVKPALPPAWEEKIEQELWQGKLYMTALLEILHLPVKPLVKKIFDFRNIENMQMFFTKPVFAYNDLKAVVDIFRKMDKTYRSGEKQYFIEVYARFKRYYPKLKPCEMFKTEWQDTFNMFKNAERKTLKRFYKQHISFAHLHDFLMEETRMNRYKRQYFKIPENIVRKLEMQLKFYNTKVIKNHRSLLLAGEKLNNCCASYNSRIGNNLQLVTMTDNTGKLVALLEIRNFQLWQAKLVNNHQVKLDSKVNEAVCEMLRKNKILCRTDDVDFNVYKESVINTEREIA